MRNENKVKNLGVIILAGGLGTRMKSENPKALSGLLENPLIFYAIKSLIDAGERFNRESLDEYGENFGGIKAKLDRIITVIGHKGDLVRQYIENEARFKAKNILFDFAVQEQYLGTGDAVKKGLEIFKDDEKETDVIILPCDMPLITDETFAETVKFHISNNADLTVMSVDVKNPYSYGRILRDKNGRVEKIIEEKELCDYPKKTAIIKEINSGVYIVKLNLLKQFINEIKPNNRKKEFYFTDIVDIFYGAGLKTLCFKAGDEEECAGVNSKYDLLNAQKIMQKRLIKNLIEKGVDFISDENIYIGYNVEIGEASVVYPDVFISGKTNIMKKVVLEKGCVIKDSFIMDNAVIKSYSVIENAVIMNNAQIGPFARIRPDTKISEGAKIGNFVEIKKSSIGRNSKASHLSYIGDSVIGENVNIGAGVITCNYDGEKKHTTKIEDGCFIGSDSQLVAPVNVGKNSYVGSGTTVTKNVPEGALAISRVPQKNIEGWVLRKQAAKKTEKD